MDKPKIADTKPVVLELAPGTYAYCTCGRAAEQPFCDGSHAGTDFEPAMIEVVERVRAAYCPCKQTREAPYCDGSHRMFTEGSSE